jgi:hypothetical protein
MEPRVLRGYAHGRAGAWEAICLDLDIAVQGRSFEDVRTRLDEAVASYIEDAEKEAPADAARLLKRRSPLTAQLRMLAIMAGAFVFGLTAGTRREEQATFGIPCHA